MPLTEVLLVPVSEGLNLFKFNFGDSSYFFYELKGAYYLVNQRYV